MCQSDEVGGQDGEDVCLNECHEQFEAIHEDTEKDAHRCHGSTHTCSHFCGHEDHAGKCQNNDVSCHDIGKKTDGQRKGFGEYADEFDGRQNGQRCLQKTGTSGQKMLL